MFASLSRPDRLLYLLIALLAALLLFPTLRWLANEWWSNDYYSHGVLVPLISGYFAWRLLPRGERRPSNLGLFLLDGRPGRSISSPFSSGPISWPRWA